MPYKRKPVNFSKDLFFYRKIKGYTQVEIAKKLGVSERTIRRWEKGKTFPQNKEKLKKLYNKVKYEKSLKKGYQIAFDKIQKGNLIDYDWTRRRDYNETRDLIVGYNESDEYNDDEFNDDEIPYLVEDDKEDDSDEFDELDRYKIEFWRISLIRSIQLKLRR